MTLHFKVVVFYIISCNDLKVYVLTALVFKLLSLTVEIKMEVYTCTTNIRRTRTYAKIRCQFYTQSKNQSKILMTKSGWSLWHNSVMYVYT